MAEKKTNELEIKYDNHKGRIRARATVVYLDGTKGRQEAYGSTKAEAKKILSDKIEKVNITIRYGEQKQNGDISLGQGVLDKIEERRKAYDREKGRETIRDSTSDRDMDVYRKLLLPHEISRKQINQIFPRDLEKYRKWLEQAQYDKCQIKNPEKHQTNMQHYSASTLNRVIRLVKAVLEDFYRYSQYKTPTGALQPFKQTIHSKTEQDFLVNDEIETALKYFKDKRSQNRYHLDETYADMFTIALMLACRPGELRGLKKRDWDPEKRNLYIRRTGEYEDGRTKTMDSQRVLPVMECAAEILQRRCEELDMTAIFSQTQRTKCCLKAMQIKSFRDGSKKQELRKQLHFHSLRGSSGTYMLEKDVPLEVVAAIMGHTKTETTRKYYVAVSERRKREVVDRMETFFRECSDTDIF